MTDLEDDVRYLVERLEADEAELSDLRQQVDLLRRQLGVHIREHGA